MKERNLCFFLNKDNCVLADLILLPAPRPDNRSFLRSAGYIKEKTVIPIGCYPPFGVTIFFKKRKDRNNQLGRRGCLVKECSALLSEYPIPVRRPLELEILICIQLLWFCFFNWSPLHLWRGTVVFTGHIYLIHSLIRCSNKAL